jgi:hypothetical protein
MLNKALRQSRPNGGPVWTTGLFFVPLVPGSGQQFSVLVFPHFLFSLFDYAAQKITSHVK